MSRHVAAVVVLLCLSTSPLSAQTAEPLTAALTVKSSANVHKYPTVASAVIGRVPGGTVLEIKRDLGSWVEVPWVDGEGGVAFVHVNAGSISRRSGPNLLTAGVSAPEASAPATEGVAGARADLTSVPARANVNGSEYVVLPRHTIGLGGLMTQAAPGFGATARTWWGNGLGLQLQLSRQRFDSLDATDRVTTIQFTPSLLYALPDSLSDSLWIRPYVGGGGSIYKSTLSSPTGPVADPITDKGLGFQAFGGAEATFAGIPRFALSADIGYRWSHTTLGGAEPDKIGLSIAGHWYVK